MLNECAPTTRRSASPLNAGRQLELAIQAPTSRSAAVAQLVRRSANTRMKAKPSIRIILLTGFLLTQAQLPAQETPAPK